MQHTYNKNQGLLGYLLLLTLFFMLMEMSVFLQASNIYLGDYKFISDHLKIPSKVIPSILFFIATQIALHLLYTLLIWMMTQGIAIALRCRPTIIIKVGISVWFLGIATLFFANQYCFPNSRFTYLTQFLFHYYLLEIVLTSCVLGFLLSLAVALWGGVITFLRLNRLKRAVILFFIILSWSVLAVSWWDFYRDPPVVIDAATDNKPNIILIGIDSLRPDFLSYFNHEQYTPHLDDFLNHATVFSNSLTPLARTFPSWVSILTGQYPKHNGIRFNLPLLNHEKKLWDLTVSSFLQQQGYETIFATDETRFSNIDKRFGFDKIITPPMGFNDFLLGTMNDFPLSNLLVNTQLGKYLFPFSYGNRSVYATYNPDAFLELLQYQLPHKRTRPLFFAVHFCLTHAPYYWGTELAKETSINDYQASVNRVDKQFNDILNLLNQKKILDHSIVILLSDHGEAIELPGDRVTAAGLFIAGKNNKKNIIPHFYPESAVFEKVDQSAGHGTDVLGLTQYHTVFAIRLYGLQPNVKEIISDRVSLLDIKPTLLDLLHHTADTHQDGVSLLNMIVGKKKSIHSQQDFFIESDFSPKAIITTHPEMREVIREGLNFFEVNAATTRINIKNSMAKMILNSKQYANIRGEWILALYPQNKTQMISILVNLKSGQWTNDLSTEFAKHSPAYSMLKSLRSFYLADLSHYQLDVQGNIS